MDPKKIVRRVRDLKLAGSKDHTVTLEDEDIKIGERGQHIDLLLRYFLTNR